MHCFCKDHPENKLSFIQLNNIEENITTDNDILVCKLCVSSNLSDQTVFSQLLDIEALTKSSEKTIFHNLPLLNNQNLLIQLSNGLLYQKDANQVAINYFNEIRNEFNQIIDEIQAETTRKINCLSEEVSNLYSRISQKDQIISILNSNNSFEQVNIEISRLFKEIIISKNENEQLIQNSMQQCSLLQEQFSIEQPSMLKGVIIQLAKGINFFGSPQKQEQDNKCTNISEQLNKMICNKSNYITNSFQKEITSILNKFSFIFDSVKNEQIYKDGEYSPIYFDALTEDRLNQLKQLIQNLSSDDPRTLQQNECTSIISQLISNPINNLTSSFQEKVRLRLSVLSPFFCDLNILSVYNDNIQPLNLNKLTKEQLQILHKIINRMLSSDENLMNEKDLIRIFLEDLKKEEIKMLQSGIYLKFIKSQFAKSQTDLQISFNEDRNTIVKKIKSNSYENNLVSDFCIERSKTYTVVFEINEEKQTQYAYFVGLTNFGQTKYLSDAKLSFCISCFDLKNEFGVNTVNKGSIKELKTKHRQYQLKINRTKSIFEISDYPNHNNIISIDSNRMSYLKDCSDLQIGFSICHQNTSLVIKSLNIVHES